MRARFAGKLVLLCAVAGFHSPAGAFKLKPSASDTENRVRYLESSRVSSYFDEVAARVVDHFSNPVHEEITHRIYGCAEPPDRSCVDPLPLGSYAPPAVVFGVQWNDNPPFQVKGISGCPPEGTTIRLPNFSACWLKLFKDAEKSAPDYYFDASSQVALIYRVHFGDLQFLHSMAAWDGIPAEDTKKRILAWAQLMYRVSTGELSPSIRLAASDIPEIRRSFAANGWTVQGLLTLGQDPALVAGAPDVAFGSLLHMIEDSFARGHVERDAQTAAASCAALPSLGKAGDILEFHSYTHQKKSRHAEFDSRNRMEAHLRASVPTVVDVGRALVEMRARNAPWSAVEPYLSQCVFPLSEERLDHPAGPGADFRM